MKNIKVGTIVNTFGIRGELKVRIQTENPQDRFAPNAKLLLQTDTGIVEVKVEGFRIHKGFGLLKLKGLDNINDVLAYKQCGLYVSETEIKRPEPNRFYYHEIIGCDVYNGETYIGKADQIDDGPQPILRVKTAEDKTILIPLVPAFLTNVDVDNKRVYVKLIEGML